VKFLFIPILNLQTSATSSKPVGGPLHRLNGTLSQGPLYIYLQSADAVTNSNYTALNDWMAVKDGQVWI
jgi:hypothetical protein